MTDLKFIPLPTEVANAFRAGGLDTNGQAAERAAAEGAHNPCRHCLDFIEEGAEMLILSHRPFASKQPYAETGPIFLCASACPKWEGSGVPPILKPRLGAEDRLIKGYSTEDRIVYGLGRVVPIGSLEKEAALVLTDLRVAYLHIRSSTNNCFTCRAQHVEGGSL